MTILKRILIWVACSILVAMILLLVVVLITTRFGWQTDSVMSGSMEPALPVGGIIITKPVKLEVIEVGDIIAFQGTGGKTAHRVVDIISKDGQIWFQTQGDKNNEPDPLLVSSADGKIRKMVWSLPYLGFVSSFLHSRFIPFLINIPALVLAWWLGKQIWIEIEKQKAKGGFREQGS